MQESAFKVTITLPSKGKLYDGKIPDGKVKISPIYGEYEEFFAGGGKKNSSIILREITSQLTELGSLAHSELLYEDWVFIVTNIMSYSYGSEVNVDEKCPKCNYKFPNLVKLSDLRCFSADDLEDDALTEPFEVKLPFQKNSLFCNFIRIRDIIAVEDMMETFRKKNKSSGWRNPERNFLIARQIHSFPVLDKEKKIEQISNFKINEAVSYVRKLIGMDIAAIKNETDSRSIGYDLIVDIICPKCRKKYVKELPPDFFRGKNTKPRRVKKTKI